MADTCLHTSPIGAAGHLFTNLVSAILTAQCSLGTPDQFPRDVADNLLDTYDFVVIGAGSAGSVLANRLSEITQWSVLLVEAGGDPPLSSEVPGLLSTIQGTDADWNFRTEPEDGLYQGMLGGRCMLPRGKALGGTSIMNAMLYVRGNKHDYETWSSLGNKGWSYEDVLPYFKKSEDYRDDDDPIYHSKGGYLTLESYRDHTPFKATLKEAAKEMGYEISNDINAENQTGFAELKGTLRDGRRCSTAKAFLSPAKSRPNLHVTKHSHVTRIVIDPYTKQATGVEFVKNNLTYIVRALKEVILSGGTINSPHILMLSGVGPVEHLQQFGIYPIIKDLQVGKNLQDHVVFPGVIFALNDSKIEQTPTLSTLESTFQFLINNSGPLTTMGVTNLMGFINTRNPSIDYPNIQLGAIYHPANDGSLSDRSREGHSEEIAKAIFKTSKFASTLQTYPFPLRPKSRGEILLRSNNPFEYPRIYTRYLTEPEDMEEMLESIDFAKKLGMTKALSDLDAELVQVEYEGCPGFDTDEYWTCAVRQVATTIHHLAGTCKMGPANDADAVVDDQLKVHGVSNLRVVDASIMPTVTSGNTNAPTIMIAEKASDMIKNTWLVV